MRKKVILRRSKCMIPLLAILMVGTTLAAMVIYYTWYVELTGAYPDIMFYNWSNGANATTITLTYNIYPGIMLIDTNATWGIKNWGTSSKNVTLWVDSCDKPNWFTRVSILILNETEAILANWTQADLINNIGEDTEVWWMADKEGIFTDTIALIINCSQNVVPGEKATLTLKLKTEG